MDEQDRDRIRLVTERYEELQGLRRVLVGATFAIILPTVGILYDANVLVALPLAAVIIFPAMLLLDGYYVRHFGRRVISDRSQKWTFLIPATFALGTVLNEGVGGLPDLMFLGLAVFALWGLVRDWPHRTYLLIEAGVALVVALSYPAFPPHDDVYYVKGFALLGVAMTVTGLLDHRLLVRAMPGRGAAVEERDEQSI